MVAGRLIALRGAAGFVVQTRLAAFASARRREGLRVAGCVEEFAGPAGAGCAGRSLRDLASGRRHIIGQDLGPGSLACHLDAAGVTNACADALRSIEAGCDLVVLAKFGKLEAVRSGLVDAFAAAIERDLPVVTAVAPNFAENWAAYSGELATYLEPTRENLDAWWRTIAPRAGRTRRLKAAG